MKYGFFCVLLFIVGCLFISSRIPQREGNMVLPKKHDFYSVLYCKIKSIDPLYGETDCDMIMQNQIFETLFEVSPDKLNIQPLLVKSYSFSSDLKKYTIVLKEGVYFHDGTMLDADDVIFTFSRIAKERPDKLGFLSKIDKRNIEGFVPGLKKINNKTIEFTLEKPNSVFFYWLADPIFSILPKSQKENLENGSFSGKPVGTGAFKFVNYIDDFGLELDAFTKYHLAVPEIAKIHFLFLSEEEAKQRFIKGEIDQIFPYRLSEREIKLADQLQEVTYRVFYTIKINPTFYISNNNPLTKLEYRKVFRQLINIPLLQKNIHSDLLDPANGFIPFGMPGYFDSEFELMSKNIFEKYLNDLRQYEIVIGCSKGVDEIEHIVDFLKNVFLKYNLNVQFKIEDVKSVFEGTRNKKYQASITSNFYRYPETLSILEQVDKFGYNSKEYSDLLELARQEADKEKRAKIYQKINELIDRDVAVIPVFHGGYRKGFFSKRWEIPKLDYVGELFMKYRYITLRK